MLKFYIFLIVSTVLLLFVPMPNSAFSQSLAVEYLCELGITYYRLGRYNDAITEFDKALMLDPHNQTAKKYISDIFQQEGLAPKKKPAEATKPQPKQIIKQPEKKLSREEIINKTLFNLSQKVPPKKEAAKKPEYKVAGIGMTGETQMRFGIASDNNTIWKRANWDMNEKNYRLLSTTAYDRKENTFDPRIYDRLRLKLDAGQEAGLGFHSDITVDPWSFTGKSSKFTVTGSGGDTAEIELKYWANTGYTINETILTLREGDSFTLPEIEIVHGKINLPISIQSAFGETFELPEVKIYRQFQPIREFWFDYKQENLKLKIFPIAYENQALTFDDPLRLSNNRTWWEDSPWLRSWKAGHVDTGASPVDFRKGYWDNTLSFFTRDSEGQRLTALRGLTFEFNPNQETSITTGIATPKDLWQDYSDVDNFLSATRVKQSLLENLNLGLTATSRLGFNLDNKDKLDSRNFVGAVDLGYEMIDGIKTNFEVAHSQLKYDLTNSAYLTKARGNAYYFSLLGRFPLQSIMDIENGYAGIQPEKDERFFTKFRFFAARMDDSFDQPLSSYVETRDDEFWSRHLHFRQPFKYYYQGEGQLLTWDDVLQFAVGNGIDIGRSTFGLRIESLLWDKKLSNLFDVRNVHATNGKFLENVGRDEFTWQINDKLTTKLLGIYHRLPKTKGGIDPYIFNPQNRVYFDNTYIEDGKSATVSTGSLGLEYVFFDGLALNGIWEYTNDLSLGYDNFPRSILNDGNRSYLTYEYGRVFRDVRNWLYSQQFFPRPPYPYYNIFKTGLRLNPLKNLEIYLDYTRNPYEKAGQVDDNLNHLGLELAYTPIPKVSLFFRYTYSRWQDLDKLTAGITKVFGHHNLFTELIFRKSQDEDFAFQYGEASRNPYMGGVLDIGWDPYGGSLRTIDTRHIFRLYYRRKF